VRTGIEAWAVHHRSEQPVEHAQDDAIAFRHETSPSRRT
jgi:hypothetical protein